MSDYRSPAIVDAPLPKEWPALVRSAILHAIALARIVQQIVDGWASNSPIHSVRFQAERDEFESRAAWAEEALRIVQTRVERIPARNRPHYAPHERLAILALQAATGWNVSQTARVFSLQPATIKSWLERANAHGESELVKPRSCVNEYPPYVTEIVRQLAAVFPFAGRRKLDEILARAGLHLSASTIERMLKREPSQGPATPEPDGTSGTESAADSSVGNEPDAPSGATVLDGTPKAVKNTLAAKRVGHFWHLDLTLVPTALGFWAPWFPFAVLPCWPFCWHVAALIDSYSRSVVSLQLFAGAPSSSDICAWLTRTVKGVGAPAYIVTDRGCQFDSVTFLEWCDSWDIDVRFGAVGKKNSIAIVERFNRTLKECLRRFVLPLEPKAMSELLRSIALWYNRHRPHAALDGATPAEKRDCVAPARALQAWETRERYPLRDRRDERKRTPARKRVEGRLRLVVDCVDGRDELPHVSLQQAA